MGGPRKGTFFLCRVIGNDLVPRHTPGQSRENLRFVLDNEPELECCQKAWVVNRIVDDAERCAITDLLEQRQEEFIELPFVPAEYARAGLDHSRFRPGFERTMAFLSLPQAARLGISCAIRRPKILAAINGNGARNAALTLGRSKGAYWILPWDGNCYLTTDAWAAIRTTVMDRDRLPYFVVPMARLTDNADIFREGFKPEANEEPQIIFRHDAREKFDERYAYGQMPKVELLWRLGVPGVWDTWGGSPWSPPKPKLSVEAGKFATAGWVARLSSGRPEQEIGPDSSALRFAARSQAILDFLQYLDNRIAVARSG